MSGTASAARPQAQFDKLGYPLHLRPVQPVRPGQAGPGTWTTFWRDFHGPGQANDRCYVPESATALISMHWSEFAARLPDRAHVLDIGCGAGIVGVELLARRPDLHVTGIDWALVSAPATPNLTILPNVDMAALPMNDATLDAAVSLFGIEYGDIAATAAELARVLRPAAPFSFLVHHRDSPTLREGCARRASLRDLLGSRVRNAFLQADAPGLDQHRRRLAANHRTASTIPLLLNPLQRNVSATKAERHAIWQELTRNLEPEIALLGHLERSAKSPLEIGAWSGHLLMTMQRLDIAVLHGTTGETIAWIVSGRR